MEEATNQINSTTLSLEIADVYTYIATLNEQIETLKSQNLTLEKQLEESIRNPPIRPPLVKFKYSDFSNQYNESIDSIQKQRDAFESECKELRNRIVELTNQNTSFKEGFGSDLSFLQTKIQQLEVLIGTLVLIPEALIKEENISDDKEIERIKENKDIIFQLKQSIQGIDALKNENQILREKVQTLIVQNNKLSEALEITKKKQENERKHFNEKETIFHLKEKQWVERDEIKKESECVLKKCQSIQDCMNILVNSWKNSENGIIEKVENELKKEETEKEGNEGKMQEDGVTVEKKEEVEEKGGMEEEVKVEMKEENDKKVESNSKKCDIIEISDESKGTEETNMSEENIDKTDLL